MLGLYVVSAQAQRRAYYRRPVIVRSYWGWGRGGWFGGPGWYDPYFYDPYLWERRERYYKQKNVRDSRRKLRSDREKYSADGVITPKEREKLDKRERSYDKAVDKLRKFNEKH